MATSKTPTYVVKFPLKLEPWQEDYFSKRMEYLRHIYNMAHGAILSEYKKLRKNSEFMELKTKKEKESFLKEYKFTVNMNGFKKPVEMTFSEFGFISFVSKMSSVHVDKTHTYKSLDINGRTLELFARELWNTYSRALFTKKTKRIKFSTKRNTISYGSHHSSITGIVLNIKDAEITVKRSSKNDFIIRFQKPDTAYEKYAINKDSDIRIVTIIRKVIRGRMRYFVHFTVRGIPYMKCRHIENGQKVGVDLGPSKVAIVSGKFMDKVEIASDTEEDVKYCKRLQRKISRSIRKINLENYNDDGTIRKIKGEKLQWNLSKNCILYKKKLADEKRKAAVRRTIKHNELANEILSHGNDIIVENNDIKSWQKRKKKSSINPETGRQRTKKRFGKSILKHAPSELITILEHKAKASGGDLYKCKCGNAATKMDIFTEETDKTITLKDRRISMSDKDVEHDRDLLAAYKMLYLRKGSAKLKDYDFEKMRADYPDFCKREQEFNEK